MTARRFLISVGVLGVIAAAALRALEGSYSAGAPLSRVVALGVAGVVPLGIAALPRAHPPMRALVAIAFAPCVAAALTSLFVDTGPAGLWTSAWMALAILVACLGLAGLKGDRRDASAWLSAAACLYLPVGAGWLVLARMGLAPLGFDPMIVLLTAIHFHFAGFGALVITARVVDRLEGRARRIGVAAGALLAAAHPIVAAGITASPTLALVGAIMVAFALLTIAALSLGILVRRLESRVARVLLAISALSLLLSMPLAVAWALGQVVGATWIDLDWMVRLHGYANAHGFITCGLAAWLFEDRASRPSPTE